MKRMKVFKTAVIDDDDITNVCQTTAFVVSTKEEKKNDNHVRLISDEIM